VADLDRGSSPADETVAVASERAHHWTAWLMVAGITLAAALGGIYGFRERLFRMAFERRSLPAMRFLLMMDPKLANLFPNKGAFISSWKIIRTPYYSYIEVACAQRDEETALLIAKYVTDERCIYCATSFVAWHGMTSVVDVLLTRMKDPEFNASTVVSAFAFEEWETGKFIINNHKIDEYYLLYYSMVNLESFDADIKGRTKKYLFHIPSKLYEKDDPALQKALQRLRGENFTEYADILEQAAREARAKSESS
jgi:hypothetical protein